MRSMVIDILSTSQRYPARGSNVPGAHCREGDCRLRGGRLFQHPTVRPSGQRVLCSTTSFHVPFRAERLLVMTIVDCPRGAGDGPRRSLWSGFAGDAALVMAGRGFDALRILPGKVASARFFLNRPDVPAFFFPEALSPLINRLKVL